MTNDEIRAYLRRAERAQRHLRALSADEPSSVRDLVERDRRITDMIGWDLCTSSRPWSPIALAGHFEAAMLAHFGHRCAYCGADLPVRRDRALVYAPAYARDHVVPQSRGGKNDHTNYVPACGACNQAKGSKELDEWTR